MPSSFGSVYTMAEMAKNYSSDGRVLAIVDVISYKAPFLEEGHWVEANNFNSHSFQQVLSKPKGTDVRANLGYGWENPVTMPVVAPIQGVAVNTKIDVMILQRERDPQGFRTGRDLITISGMKNTVHDRMLYGNMQMFQDQINGIWTMLPNLASGGPIGPSVQDNGGRIAGGGAPGTAGGMSGESSTYSIKWGPGGFYFTFPRGGRDFIIIKDGGEQLVPDNNNPARYFWAMVSTYIIQFGSVMEDPRAVQRVANIDVGPAAASTWGNPTNVPVGTQPNSAYWQIAAYSQFPDDILDGVVTYADRPVWTQMNQALEQKSNVWLTMDEAWGRRVLHCHMVPVKLCERIMPVTFGTSGIGAPTPGYPGAPTPDFNPFTGAIITTPTVVFEPVAS